MFSVEDTTTNIESEDEADSLSLLTGKQRKKYYVDLKISLQNGHKKKQGSIVRYIMGFFK